MKKYYIFHALLALLLVGNLLVGYQVYSADEVRDGEDRILAKISIMMRVLHLIRQDYVDEDKTDYEALVNSAIEGMVASLDPYSSYLEQDEYQEMMETTEGQFGGLGVVVTIRDGYLTIIAPMEDTPGSRAGLLPNDRIVEIDGEPVDDEKLNQIIRRLKGEPGTEVTLTIERPGLDKPFDVTLVRAIIEVPSVKSAQIIRNGVGYIRITQFDDNTAPGLEKALAELKKQKMVALVLDLRSNPGGLLNSAVDTCSFFIEKDKLVVSTEGRKASQKERFLTGKCDKYLDVPLAILVNGGSASAAEIVSGCLQDWNRAILVGEKTFGKGSVQNIIRLPDDSALRLTTAKYYTPSRRIIHEKGIEPNITVKLTDEQIAKLIEKQRKSTGQPMLDVENDAQLGRALDSLESYQVYRGLRKGNPESAEKAATPAAVETAKPEAPEEAKP